MNGSRHDFLKYYDFLTGGKLISIRMIRYLFIEKVHALSSRSVDRLKEFSRGKAYGKTFLLEYLAREATLCDVAYVSFY